MPATPSPSGRAFTPEPQGSRSPAGARGLGGARPSGAVPPRPPVGSGPGVSDQGRRWDAARLSLLAASCSPRDHSRIARGQGRLGDPGGDRAPSGEGRVVPRARRSAAVLRLSASHKQLSHRIARIPAVHT